MLSFDFELLISREWIICFMPPTHLVTLDNQPVWPSFSLSFFVCKTVFLRTPVLRGVEWLCHEKMISSQLSSENTTYSSFCGRGGGAS